MGGVADENDAGAGEPRDLQRAAARVPRPPRQLLRNRRPHLLLPLAATETHALQVKALPRAKALLQANLYLAAPLSCHSSSSPLLRGPFTAVRSALSARMRRCRLVSCSALASFLALLHEMRCNASCPAPRMVAFQLFAAKKVVCYIILWSKQIIYCQTEPPNIAARLVLS